MHFTKKVRRFFSAILALMMLVSMMPVNAFATEADDTLQASLDKAKSYIDGITINNSSNDPATVVKTFKKHFTWDNEKRENSKSYLFDWSYYNGVVFEGIEYVYEATGESVYKDYVVEYMSSLINSNGGWATCTNSGYTSKQCAGYNSTHGADCYKTASLLMDAYEMTGDSRYLTMAKTLYADLTTAAKSYSLSKAGNNFRHTWASDPSPDLWLDGLYMILPFRAEYAKYIGDTAELDLIVSRMQWVSDNMYNSSKGLFYHAADSASSNSGTFWLRSIGWYAAAIVDIMDSMSGSNLEAMKAQLVKLVDGMKACQNASNGMWLNNMAASQSSSNPYETSGTALVCYAVMKAVNNGWLDESYADMAILAFNGICNEKLSGSTLTDICFKGAPGSSNSTFYDNEGKGVGPFIMFYAEVLKYASNHSCDHNYEAVTEEATCVKDGSVTYTCTLCGESYSEVIPATGVHTYETVTVEATCTETGSITTTCADCGDSTVEEIAAKGHEYACVVIDATCAKDGSKVYTCTVCEDTYTESIPATGEHSYNSVKVDATCVDKGSVTYTCAVCGDSYAQSIPATGIHLYKSETVNATCTQDGAVVYTCPVCGDSYSEAIAAAGHNYTCVITEATCTKDGSSVYTCSVCGDTYTEAIPATGHNYAGVVTGATCTEGGFTTYTCVGCGDSYIADHTEALGHTYETATVDATCTTDGSVTYYCACGDIYTEVIPSNGHNYQTVTTAPTCTSGGYTTHTCSACGDSYVTDNTAALGHTYETVTVEPTCTVGGYTASTCTVCGEGKTYNETAALGHDYVSVTVDPTETEGGYTTHTCNVCGHSYTDTYVDALGHTIVSVVTDPTCTSDGYTTHTCTTCGEVTVDTYVPALGHNYQTVTVDATCTADGSVSGSCTTCGDAYNKVIGAYGHNYIASVTAPTCTEGGHTVYSCDRCGDNYMDDHTEALGHNYSTIITDVTCTQDGYTTHLCTNCGDSYIGETIVATGHSYETVTAEATCTEKGSITYICGSCGDTYAEEIPAAGHNYHSVITEPTCSLGGYTTYTCDACGQSYTDEETAATGHSYSVEDVNGNQVYTCDHCGDTYTVATGWIAQSGRYVLDTDGVETGEANKYIIVGSNKDYALTLSGSTIGAASVSINNNTIYLSDASKYEFYFADNSKKESGSYLLTQDGSKGIYHSGGNMYYGSDNKGYWHIGTGSNGAYQLYDYDNLNWFLNYGYVWASDSVSRFAVSSNARSVRLFKATDSYVRLYGELNQVWPHGADATESAVLNKIQIQTSTDGVTASGSVAVDSSMISWDKAFDGYTAGTYTATVSYNGESIGTVTVVVTGEHVYETEVVAATCTAQGYSTHTCADCGTSYTDSYTNALGHSYSAEEGSGYITYTCNRCGDSYTESTISYQRVSSISSGNKYVITLYSGNKYYAVSHASNKLSAVQVTVSNGQITSEISSDMLWNYSGNKLSYTSGSKTYYLYTSASNSWWGNWWGSSSVTLGVSTSSSSNVSLSSNKLKVGSYYLRYSNGSISANSSATTAYAFIEK